jgi:hypothetical protein
MGTISGLAILSLWITPAPSAQTVTPDDPGERIYGRVLTTSGETREGFLRWDRNETHWADLLEGRGFIAHDHAVEAERLDEELRRRRELERSVSLPGLRITWEEDDDAPLESTPAAVRFGQLRAIEPRDRRVLLTLESGDTVELASSGSDLGRSFRALIVEAAGREDLELEWEDIVRVELMAAPPNARPPVVSRLHGTLRLRGGEEWTGYVAWDLDESVTTDVLDGESPDDVRHEIAFGDIASIARESGSRARVRLRSGEDLVLSGTNDVNDDIRGIEVVDPAFGRVIVGWDQFESLAFHPRAEPAVAKSLFAVTAPLRGTVMARDRRAVSGLIRWDNDEERAWEVLDAEADGVEISIEMGRIRSIVRDGDSATVTLHDGRAFVLEGTEDLSDLGEANRGVFVTQQTGETGLVRWRDLLSATFDP